MREKNIKKRKKDERITKKDKKRKKVERGKKIKIEKKRF